MGIRISKPFSPSEIVYGSFAVYPHKGGSGVVESRARTVLLGIKKNAVDITVKPSPPRFVDVVIERLARVVKSGPLATLFDNPEVVLVPTPGHGVTDNAYLWSTKIVCDTMRQNGLGREVRPFVKRVKGVLKAATAPYGERPTPAEHYASMQVVPGLHVPDDILVVDDILTYGCTQAGAVARLTEAFPRARIRAFAVARTDDLTRFPFLNPHVGRIIVRSDGSWAERDDQLAHKSGKLFT